VTNTDCWTNDEFLFRRVMASLPRWHSFLLFGASIVNYLPFVSFHYSSSNNDDDVDDGTAAFDRNRRNRARGGSWAVRHRHQRKSQYRNKRPSTSSGKRSRRFQLFQCFFQFLFVRRERRLRSSFRITRSPQSVFCLPGQLRKQGSSITKEKSDQAS
jgi:hypothetical protein